MNPGMIVIGGLPGTGKSSVAKPLARRLKVPYLRIDTIEQALVESQELHGPPGVAGYVVGHRIAADQVRVGLNVVIECVNPLKVTRDAWQVTAEEHHAWLLEIETTCSDAREHRRRVEARTVDIPGLLLPSWQQVLDREYVPWDREHLVLDTFTMSTAESVESIMQRVDLVAQVPAHRGPAGRAPRPFMDRRLPTAEHEVADLSVAVAQACAPASWVRAGFICRVRREYSDDRSVQAFLAVFVVTDFPAEERGTTSRQLLASLPSSLQAAGINVLTDAAASHAEPLGVQVYERGQPY